MLKTHYLREAVNFNPQLRKDCMQLDINAIKFRQKVKVDRMTD